VDYKPDDHDRRALYGHRAEAKFSDHGAKNPAGRGVLADAGARSGDFMLPYHLGGIYLAQAKARQGGPHPAEPGVTVKGPGQKWPARVTAADPPRAAQRTRGRAGTASWGRVNVGGGTNYAGIVPEKTPRD